MVAELQHAWDVYDSIFVLINAKDKALRPQMSVSRDNIAQMTVAVLRRTLIDLNAEIDRLKHRYGVAADDDFLIGLATRAEHPVEGAILMIPKYMLESVFDAYENALPNFNDLQPHARIGIDPGRFRNKQGSVEIYLPEAILFEDMCMLNNLFLDNEASRTKIALKKRDTLARSLIDAAFRFLEGFLNGIAFDYYYANHHTIGDREKSILLEWDFDKDRVRYVPFRDKLIKYPRIISGANRAPLTETNCPSIAFLVHEIRPIRDAVVHASSFVDPLTHDVPKERAFYADPSDRALQTVNATIDVVQRIHQVIRKQSYDLWWFTPDRRDGRFADSVFR